jgi:hypothetical protein
MAEKFTPKLESINKAEFYPIGTVLGPGGSVGTVILHGDELPPVPNGRTWCENIVCTKRSLKNCPLCFFNDECPIPANKVEVEIIISEKGQHTQGEHWAGGTVGLTYVIPDQPAMETVEIYKTLTPEGPTE